MRLDLYEDKIQEAYITEKRKGIGMLESEISADYFIKYRPGGVERFVDEGRFFRKFLPEFYDRESFEIMHALALENYYTDEIASLLTFHITPDGEAALGLVATETHLRKRGLASALVKTAVSVITEIQGDEKALIAADFPERLNVPAPFQNRVQELVKYSTLNCPESEKKQE